jgi:hypothetical protein
MIEFLSMLSISNTRFALLLIATSAITLTLACHKRGPSNEADNDTRPIGEPEQYSATIVRIVDDGTNQQTSVTREARSGEKRRQEWTEENHNHALIWRPDLGKGFLLDLDERDYVEIEITRGHEPERTTDSLVEAVDRVLDDAPSPTSVEIRALPDQMIGGYQCRVSEQRASFPDGHTETVKTFRARDLNGLAVRTETETDIRIVKVITERRDIVTEIATDAFEVPSDFKRVERLK